MPSPLDLGLFIVPDATNPDATVEQIIEAERCGLDVVGVQDHPYQWRFLDTWTLLAYAAAKTERVRLVPDVLNLPLRLPTMIAKSVASLDVLSGGRVELGIGAGTFWDAVEAMGGPRRTGKESVDALEEAVAILRAFWSGERSVIFNGQHYQVNGAHPGPAPLHPVGIWLGAYGPRMLRLTGQLADGWLPSLGGRYLSTEDVAERQGVIDEAALRAGRDPAEIERAANLMALEGQPDGWPEQLARVASELRFSTLFANVPSDDPLGFVRRLGEDVAPRVRELLA
jgi:alkanesulfonate monooxygenase SsuD/methylene tetrahydromethanopterin reductase-like flavin-dependent oxidoreductase (luciferase family)